MLGGQLAEDRLASYFKLQRELAHIRKKQSHSDVRDTKRKSKSLSKQIRRNYSERRREWGR